MKHDFLIKNYKFKYDSRCCLIHRSKQIKNGLRQIELYEFNNVIMLYGDVYLIKRTFLSLEGECINYKEEVEPYLPF